MQKWRDGKAGGAPVWRLLERMSANGCKHSEHSDAGLVASRYVDCSEAEGWQ
jgi:hypothetical protein